MHMVGQGLGEAQRAALGYHQAATPLPQVLPGGHGLHVAKLRRGAQLGQGWQVDHRCTDGVILATQQLAAVVARQVHSHARNGRVERHRQQHLQPARCCGFVGSHGRQGGLQRTAQPGHGHAIVTRFERAGAGRHDGARRCVDGEWLGCAAVVLEDARRASHQHRAVEHQVRQRALTNLGQHFMRPVCHIHLHPLRTQTGKRVAMQRALPQVGVGRAGGLAQTCPHTGASVVDDDVHGVAQVHLGGVSANLQGVVAPRSIVDARQRRDGDGFHWGAPLRYCSALPSGLM